MHRNFDTLVVKKILLTDTFSQFLHKFPSSCLAGFLKSASQQTGFHVSKVTGH